MRMIVLATATLLLAAADWLAFHDLIEHHTVTEYLMRCKRQRVRRNRERRRDFVPALIQFAIREADDVPSLDFDYRVTRFTVNVTV